MKRKWTLFRAWMVFICTMLLIGFVETANAANSVINLPENTVRIEAETFRGDVSIKEVILPDTVTTIGPYAFAESSLIRVNVPASVSEIGDGAFDGIPDEAVITVIEGSYGEEYFSSFEHEYTVIAKSGIPEPDYDFIYRLLINYLEDGSVELTVRGFYSGSEQTIVRFGRLYNDFPIKRLIISDRAFYQNASLTEAPVFPEGVELVIGEEAFYQCNNMTGEMALPDSTKTIGRCAFNGCTGLTSLVLPKELDSLGRGAFEYCSGLTEVVFPESMEVIPNFAFAYASNITGITFPQNIREIGEYAFTGITGLKGNLEIPGTVESIGYSAFDGCRATGRLILHEGLTTIHTGTFRDCSFTGGLTIPNSVTYIEGEAFKDSSFSGHLSLGHGVETIAASAFEEAGEFTGGLTIPSSIRVLQGSAFKGTIIRGSLVFEEGIETIGDYAFSECTFTGSLALPDSLNDLAEHAFVNCNGLNATLMIGSNTWTTYKGEYYTLLYYQMGHAALGAFGNCKNLRTVIVPDGNTCIPPAAFFGCTSLQKVSLADSVTSINAIAFGECKNLIDINLGGITEWGQFGNLSYFRSSKTDWFHHSTFDCFPLAGCTKLQGVLDLSGLEENDIFLSWFKDFSHLGGIIVGKNTINGVYDDDREDDPDGGYKITMASSIFTVYCPFGSQSEEIAREYKVRYCYTGLNSYPHGLPYGELPLGEPFYFHNSFAPTEKPRHIRATITDSTTKETVQSVTLPVEGSYVYYKCLDGQLKIELLPEGEYDLLIEVETGNNAGHYWPCANSHFSIIAKGPKAWIDRANALPTGLIIQGSVFETQGILRANRPMQSVRAALVRNNDEICAYTVNPDGLTTPLNDLITVLHIEDQNVGKYILTIDVDLSDGIIRTLSSEFVLFNYDGLIDEDTARKIIEWCRKPDNNAVFDKQDYTEYLNHMNALDAAAMVVCNYSDIIRDNLISALSGNPGDGFVTKLYKETIYEMMKNLDVEVVAGTVSFGTLGDQMKKDFKDFATLSSIGTDEVLNSFDSYSQYLKEVRNTDQATGDAVTKLLFQDEISFVKELKKEAKTLGTVMKVVGYGKDVVELFIKVQADYHKNMVALASLAKAYGDYPPVEFTSALQEIMMEYQSKSLIVLTEGINRLEEELMDKAMEVVIDGVLTGLNAISQSAMGSITLTYKLVKFAVDKTAEVIAGDLSDRDYDFLTLMNTFIQSRQAYWRAFQNVMEGDTSSDMLSQVYVTFNATKYAMEKMYDTMIEAAYADFDEGKAINLTNTKEQISSLSIL